MTDPVYEGKSMQGLIDLVRKGFFPPVRRSSTRTSGACPRSRLQLRLPQRLTAPAPDHAHRLAWDEATFAIPGFVPSRRIHLVVPRRGVAACSGASGSTR